MAIKVKIETFKSDGSASTYACCLPSSSAKKRTIITEDELPKKRLKIVEQNRKNETWLSNLKQTFSPQKNSSKEKKIGDTSVDFGKKPSKKKTIKMKKNNKSLAVK